MEREKHMNGVKAGELLEAYNKGYDSKRKEATDERMKEFWEKERKEHPPLTPEEEIINFQKGMAESINNRYERGDYDNLPLDELKNLTKMIDKYLYELEEKGMKRTNPLFQKLQKTSFNVHDLKEDKKQEEKIKFMTKNKDAKYLHTFFEEKKLPSVSWELQDNEGTTHFIDSDFVDEAIFNAPQHEQKGIGDMIRKIDFANGDVNDYLKHLAQALVNNY